MQMEPTASYMELPVMCEMPVDMPAPQPPHSLRGLKDMHWWQSAWEVGTWPAHLRALP